MEIKTLATVALMMISGLLFGRLCKFIKLPNVTGYLIAGLVFGPSLFNIVDQNMIDEFTIISDIALSFIAFSVGCDFSLDYFKKVGSAPIIVAIFEAMGAVILLTVTLIICKVDLKLSILLGAIAAATAPAQTIMVINQYKAKGPLTSLLLSVVALDDAVALIGFGFASTIVTAMNGKGDRSLVLSILDPFYQVLISAVIGFVLALVMKVLLKWFKKHSNRICVILGMVALTYYLATLLKGSSLLACMCLGAVLTNIIHDSDDVVKVSEGFTPPIYMMFFVISGAGFDVSALKSIGFIGIIYVVVRVIGKMLGSYVSGKITHQPDKVCKWLGPTLMPQAGVALGLIAVASSMVPDYAPQLRTVILCSTFIYSIIGPGVAKLSLVKAGEIVLPDKKQKKVGA